MYLLQVAISLLVTTSITCFGAGRESLTPIDEWRTGRDASSPTFILGRTGESFLIYRSSTVAGALLILVPRTSRQKIAKAFAENIAKQTGIKRIDTNDNSNLLELATAFLPSNKNEYVDRLNREHVKQVHEKLKLGGFGTGTVGETRIIAKPSNLLGRRDASSELIVHVVDAREIFGVIGSLVIIYRWDRAKEWGFLSAHDLFSFGYHRVELRVFTKTELRLVDEAMKDVATEYLAFGIGQNLPFEYLEELGKAKSWLEAQSKCGR